MAEAFEEKRKEPRVEKELKVGYEFFHLEETVKYDFSSSTSSLDVSCSGIRLTDAPDADINMKNPIELTISFPDSDETFIAIGQVKWKKENEGKLHFGVEILSMGEWEKFKSMI